MRRVARQPIDHADGDAGFSLVEVLVAVALLGLAVVSIFPAMITVVRASSGHEHLADARRWIVSAGDFAASGVLPRANCDSVADYEQLIQTGTGSFRPDHWQPSQLTITDVSYWNGSTFGPTCTDPSPPQQIKLQVRDAAGRAVATLDVVMPGVANV
jgi:prepilin-type N-terminal cleavage/methylation domain-containing protein